MNKVAVFNDLSGFGRCSLGVAIPVLSVMGVQCCSIPSAILTSQTGYDHFYSQDLTEMIPRYTESWRKNGESFEGIYSGYATGPIQISLFMDFVDTFYTEKTILIVDPVMGDDGRTYKMFNDGLKKEMSKLVRKADLITPNLTEACLLAGIPISAVTECKDTESLFSLANEAAKQILSSAKDNLEIIITGIKCRGGDEPFIYNYLVSREKTFTCGSKFVDKSFSGTGDLMASIICGAKVNSLSTEDACKLATDFLYTCIVDTVEEGIPTREGVNFEKYLHFLAKDKKGEKI